MSPAPGGRRPSAVAPWTRTRLRASKGAALALVLLVLGCAFLAAGLPRDLDRYQAAALRHTLSSAAVTDSSIEGSATVDPGEQILLSDPGKDLSPGRLSVDGSALQQDIRPPLTTEPGQADNGVHTIGTADDLSDAQLPRPSELPPTLNLDWQPDQGAHVRMVAGRLPRDPAPFPADGTDSTITPVPPLEIAVSGATARTMGLHVGSVLHLQAQEADHPVQLDVVGVFQPLGAGRSYWTAEPDLLRPELRAKKVPRQTRNAFYWHVEALVSSGASPWLPDLGATQAYWWFPVDPAVLTPFRVAAAQQQLADLTSGPDAAALARITQLPSGLTVTSSLPSMLGGFTAESSAIAPVLTIGCAGAAGTAAAVLLLAAGLAADRRTAELELLRARGGSLPALARRLLAETLVCTTTGAAGGAALALLLLPTAHWRASVLAAAAVWLLATAVVPLRVLARHRRPRPAGRAEGLVTARPSRRRTIAELTVLVASAAALLSLNRQGLDAGGGIDPLLASAPPLLGLSGALLLIRLCPWPLRALSRPSARRRGAVGFLGLARAGRTATAVSLLPLVAMLMALTVATFGSVIVSSISGDRESAALAEVGADAALTSQAGFLPPALTTAVGHSAGVRSVVDIRLDPYEEYAAGDITYNLELVDPAPYAALAARDGKAFSFSPALLHYSGSGPIPVVASGALAAAMGPGPVTLDNTAYGNLQVRVVATVGADLANQVGEFLLVPRAAVPRAPYEYALPQETLLLSGPVDAAALQRTVDRTEGRTVVDVTLRTAVLAAQADDSPLQSGAESVYTWTVLASVLLSGFAVLLSLLQAAPGRAALLARLRTMGLTPRQGYRLIVLESLPQVLLGVTAGAATGLAAIALLRSSIDLPLLVATDAATGPTALRPQLLPVLGPALALLVLALAVVAAEAAVVGRRQIGTELRAGDQR